MSATRTSSPADSDSWQQRLLPGGAEVWGLNSDAEVAQIVDAMVEAGAWALFETTTDTSDRTPSDVDLRAARDQVRASLVAAVSPTPDLDTMTVTDRDTLVSTVLRFMTARGYRVEIPAGAPATITGPLPTAPGSVVQAWFGEQPVPSVIALDDTGWYFTSNRLRLDGTVKHISRWVPLVPAVEQQ